MAARKEGKGERIRYLALQEKSQQWKRKKKTMVGGNKKEKIVKMGPQKGRRRGYY